MDPDLKHTRFTAAFLLVDGDVHNGSASYFPAPLGVMQGRGETVITHSGALTAFARRPVPKIPTQSESKIGRRRSGAVCRLPHKTG